MEALTMTNRYNLSLVFYPQPDGQYHVACPDLPNCYTCGSTIEDARERIYELISDMLPEQINSGAEDEEALRLGLCMEGKLYQEVKVTLDDTGEIRFPGTRASHVA
jgi:predicted RNase H-like HicB family nuclease